MPSPWYINANRTRVKQVFINPLSNAIKYNPVGGRVEVRCTAAHGGRTRINFQDTGEGLSADNRSQLFQPFNRLGQDAGVEEGTGIDLVLSKRLVELMGGEIGADSTVGVGSVFWIELDGALAPHALDEAAELPAPPTPVLLPGTPVRTLLRVEDNPANLMLVEKLLARRPDLRLLTARDGNSGIGIGIGIGIEIEIEIEIASAPCTAQTGLI